jgi:hypothetical protein
MSPEERAALVAAYIEHKTVTHVWGADKILREVRGRDNFWAWEKMEELCRTDPESCWELILQILQTPHAESVAGALAAGPLESLLAKHGAQFIDRVEQQAARDPHFKELLAGVWRSTSTPEVWARVEKCQE